MPYLLKYHLIAVCMTFLLLLKNWRASAFRHFFPYSRHAYDAKILSSALCLKLEDRSGFKSSSPYGAKENSSRWRKLPLDKAVIPLAEYSKDDFETRDNLSKSTLDPRPMSSPGKASPVELRHIRGEQVYFKRDDLLRLPGSGISGNKARKMLALNQIPAEEFPECVASYGGPQSNAMLAIAAIVHSKNLELDLLMSKNETTMKSNSESLPLHAPRRFIYYVKKLPRFLKKNPSGNFFRAKMLGMELVELTNSVYHDYFRRDYGAEDNAPNGLEAPVPYDSAWIPQGGACSAALPGGTALANEIILFWSENGKGRPLTVLLPGGTCSSALILHREIRRIQEACKNGIKLDIKVVVIPCIGDEGYALRQMMGLNMATGGSGERNEIPSILKPAPDADFYLEDNKKQQYIRFGEPNREVLRIYQEMEESGMNIDLLYGAPSWSILLRHWPETEGCKFGSPLLDRRELLYVHSGGLEGINSQLMRYRHKGLIEGRKVQHPERQRRSSKELFRTGDLDFRGN
mmetsp:Transcript_5255/g.7591  ORF Transcript_5255/g.7591 Transcript_5255/m.7591 type:complete len:518 (-) Transcript_5255:72-1625(-)|eukprot:CAMPEP_0194201744 /NCGR_PEP_ID=MMETSP0156-20130528/1943_1 /TAXON_ID=33649 /ORGANISM="Thalassionema nitzschioides, Strain L26-B" /LENGTH=517 /DNA_ID=CAMNT_0038927029 /DNA_START=115 /DNA_END=1668 /DNA_ORIENTATION=+